MHLLLPAWPHYTLWPSLTHNTMILPHYHIAFNVTSAHVVIALFWMKWGPTSEVEAFLWSRGTFPVANMLICMTITPTQVTLTACRAAYPQALFTIKGSCALMNNSHLCIELNNVLAQCNDIRTRLNAGWQMSRLRQCGSNLIIFWTQSTWRLVIFK